MANEIVGKVVSLVEMDLDVYRATQFETTRNSDSVDVHTRVLLHFDGVDASTSFLDSSVTPKIFTANGNAQIDTAQSKFGGASGLFDGAGDYISTPDHVDFTLGVGDWTAECWFQVSDAGTSRHMWGQTDAAAANTSTSIRMYRHTDNRINAIAAVGSILFQVTGTTQYTDALNPGWHHAAFVRTGNTLKLFLDGVQEGGNVAITGSVNDSSNAFALGRLGEFVGSEWFGWIDEFRLSSIARWIVNFTPPTAAYHQVPTPVVLLLHFDPGGINGVTDIRDFSANGRTVTVGGNARVDTLQSKFGGASLIMDGVGDYVAVPAHVDMNLGAEDFTIDFWIYSTAPAGQINICGQSDSAFSVGSSGWFIIRQAGFIQASVVQGGTSISCISTTALANDSWHHIAFVRQGHRIRLYLDGVPNGENLVAGPINDSAFATSVGRVGEIVGNTVQGWIDEFSIVKGAAKFTGAFTPPTKAYTLEDFPPDNWSVHWNPENVVLIGADVPEFPSGRGLRIIKTLNDGGGQTFVKYALIQGIHNVSAVGLFRVNAPASVGGAVGIILRGDTDILRGYRLRFENNANVTLAVLNPSATTFVTTAFAFASGEDLWMRYDVADIAGGGVLHRAKWWRGERSDEPSGFMLVHNEATATIPSSGNSGYVGITCPGANSYHDNLCGFFRAQSLISYQNETLRFAIPTSYLPKEFNAIPSIISIAQSPVTLSLGENLGSRAQVNVVFRDHKHAEQGEFYNNGTYWSRFRARNLFRRVQPLTVKMGYLVHNIEDYEVRHYYLESFDGPTFDDKMTILAQDVLKLADNDKAQAPLLNNGFLAAAITNVQTTAQLLPSGIGDQEYATSGFLAIGGEEIVSFTRSGDSLVIARAQFGTVAAAHDAEDRVQTCIEYNSDTAPFIAHDLLVNYANVNASLIDLPTWELEASTYLQRQYTRLIAEPTGVSKLLTELIQQAGLIIWNDTSLNQIRFQVIRGVSTTAFEYNEENCLMGSTRVMEQRNKIITEAWVYFGVKNPLEPLDQENNYRSALAVPNLEAATLNGASVIKRVFGTWMPAFARDTAERVIDLQLSRFSVPPRRVQFAIPRHSGITQPTEAGGYQFRYHGSTDELGSEVTMPIQVVRVEPKEDKLSVEAEEMLFTAFDQDDLVNRVITIDANINGVNVKTLHDSIYPEITAADVIASPPVTLTVIVNSGVIVGGVAGTPLRGSSGSQSSGNAPAFDVGTGWPAGLLITVQIIGRVQGYGGFGGCLIGTFDTDGPGWPGGTALFTRFPINLDLSSGVAQIWGGGGGGGVYSLGGGNAHGGGGGQGQPGGIGGSPSGTGTAGENGTSEERGASGLNVIVNGGVPTIFVNDSDGGAAGLGGDSGLLPIHFGGQAGYAIDGLSFVNFLTGYGDIRGLQFN